VHFLRTPRSGTFAVSIEGEQRPMEVEGYSPVRRADEVTMEGGPWWYPDVPGRIEITLPREGEPTSGAELEIDFFILSRQPSPSANGNMVLLENVESALLRAASVRYVLSQELLGGPGRTEVATSPNTHLYEVSRAVPRAYLSTRPMRVDDDEEALHRLMRPDWSPETETVIVAAREADWIEPRLVESVEAHYPMRLAARGPNEVRAELRPAQRSVGNYAVVTDAVYPGWHAFVGGEQRPIHAANYVFRATYLPSGERAVSFVYLPASFKVGCFISLLAATVLASVLVLDAIGRGSRIR
ncbi:MAG: YfhO family protein, partial [Armatimonadota bacterium]